MQGHKITTLKSSAISSHNAVATARRGKQLGISLIETMIVVSIMVITVGTAVPFYQGFQERRRLEGYATELVADIQYLRSEAVARNRRMLISFGTDAGGTCYVLHTGYAGNCSCTSGGFAQCNDPNNSTIKSVGLATNQGVRLQANVSSMLFDPARGTTSPTGSIDFIANSGKTIRQVINITGRTRSCSPLGSLNGYKIC